MSKCCVICVGRNADRAADRIEAYAKKADFEIVETIFKDTKSVERLKFYIERDSIISILVYMKGSGSAVTVFNCEICCGLIKTVF